MGKTGKRLLAAALALGLGLFAACGAPEETDAELTAAFTDLLAADYEVYYLFYSGGLPVDQGVTLELEGAEYHPVSSAEYRSLQDLRELLERVYADERTVEALLAVKDPHGVPLLAEEEGVLYRSATRDIYALGYEAEEETAALASRDGDRAVFTFRETGLDGSLYETEMAMTRTSRGWRLEGPRSDARRELVREGSGEESAIGAGEAREVAEGFLSALTAGDAAALAQMTQGKESLWSAVRVSRAEIAQAEEELDSQGSYLVDLSVEEGGGILEEGEGEYRLQVGFEPLTGKVSPLYFQPAGREYYNWQDSAETVGEASPGWLVEEFIRLYGTVTFASPEELPAETVAEFSIVRLAEATGQWDRVYTLEEVAAEAERTFGLAAFDAGETPFYSEAQGGCLMLGRGGSSFNMLMEMPAAGEEGVLVRVGFYRDLLCTDPENAILYTLEELPEGGWRLLSALPE